MTSVSERFSEKFNGFVFVVAPLLFSLSTFYWQDGEYNVTGSTLLVISMVFWVPVFFVLFAFLKLRMPVYYHVGLIAAMYGTVVGGTGFGYLGYFATVFNVQHEAYITTLSSYPVSSNVLLFQAGPLFPLSLLILGINLIRTKSLPSWLGFMIVAGAIAFPLSRIPRIEWLAHTADLLLSIPLFVLGYRFIKPKQ